VIECTIIGLQGWAWLGSACTACAHFAKLAPVIVSWVGSVVTSVVCTLKVSMRALCIRAVSVMQAPVIRSKQECCTHRMPYSTVNIQFAQVALPEEMEDVMTLM
jgi:hypothetical protein